MTVNVNSVIPLWVNTWNPTLYNSLTDKENWSYVNQGLIWVPLFTQLANALNSYQAYNRQTEISNFFFGAYAYVTFNKIYGTDGSQISNFNAQNIYNLNGLVNAIINRPVSYYNDISIVIPSTDYNSPLMQADILQIYNSSKTESTLIANLSNLGRGAIQNLQVTLLFKDVKPIQVLTKDNMKTLFFVNLNWNQVYNALNIGGLVKP